MAADQRRNPEYGVLLLPGSGGGIIDLDQGMGWQSSQSAQFMANARRFQLILAYFLT